MSKFLTKNTMAKIFSVLFAFGIWLFVMREINPQVTRDYTNIPVNLIGIEDLRQQDLVILGEASPVINVRVRGRRDEVNKLSPRDLRPVADLRGFGAGLINVPVEIPNIANIQIDFSPKFIRLQLEEIIRVQKEVEIDVVGSPRTGYIFGELQYRPTLVWLEGPESKIETVSRVVATLHTAEETEGITASLPLKALTLRGAEVMDIAIKTPYVDVFMPIDRLKTVEIEPNFEVRAAQGYMITDISLIPEQISIRGTERVLRNIDSLLTDYIIIDGISSTGEVEIALLIPEGVSLLNDEPIRARIVVEELEERNYTIPQNNLLFMNIEEGLRINKDLLPVEYSVSIVAPGRILDLINDRNLKLVFDLSQLAAGQHVIEGEINLPFNHVERIESFVIQPRSVTIILVPNNS